MSYTCPSTPRLPTIPLPIVTPPFFIRASLAQSPQSTITLDFGDPTLLTALSSLTPDEASRPATSPATNVLRIVHPALEYNPIYILPRPGSNVVSVMDLLSGVHHHLWSPLPNINDYDTMRRGEIVLAAQERCQRRGVANDSVRHIDLLDHATAFAGLVQDIALARSYVGVGHLGVDAFQAVTWILQTQEPLLMAPPHSPLSQKGLGPYPRWR
jgi:hypothetical protein